MWLLFFLENIKELKLLISNIFKSAYIRNIYDDDDDENNRQIENYIKNITILSFRTSIYIEINIIFIKINKRNKNKMSFSYRGGISTHTQTQID